MYVTQGVLTEELSHGINYKTGADKGKGTETLAGYSNDYFTGKLGDNNTSLSLIGDGKDYNSVDFGEHVGDKAVLGTNNENYKRTINNILIAINTNMTNTVMTNTEMRQIKDGVQRSTADELEVLKIGDTYYLNIKNKISDEEIGIGLSVEDRNLLIESTHYWREIIEKNDKNVYFQANTQAPKGDAQVATITSDIKNVDGKYTVDNVVMLFNSDSMKKSV